MIHLDTAQLTPTIIDESVDRFAYTRATEAEYALENAMLRSPLLRQIHRNMPVLCMRQAAFNWLRIGVILGFKIAEKLADPRRHSASQTLPSAKGQDQHLCDNKSEALLRKP